MIEPYPLCVDSLRLETAARRLAARPYPNDAELQAALRTAPVEVLVLDNPPRREPKNAER